MLTSMVLSSRKETSPGGPGGAEETQASCCRSRSRRCQPSSEGCKGSRSQVHPGCRCSGHSGRVPPTEQDPVLTGPARQRGPGEPHRHLWPLRGLQGGPDGAWSEGYRVRRIRERNGGYQCEGGDVGDAHGRCRQAHPGHIPEAMRWSIYPSCTLSTNCYGRLEIFYCLKFSFIWRRSDDEICFISLQQACLLPRRKLLCNNTRRGIIRVCDKFVQAHVQYSSHNEMLEYNVLIFMLPEDVCSMCDHLSTWTGRFACLLFPFAQNISILGSVISLLLVGNLLESIEFFSIEFIELRIDVLGRISQESAQPWDGVDKHLMVFSVRGIITCSLFTTM